MTNRVHLLGPRWDTWRGAWEGSRCLIRRGGEWYLEDNGKARRSWPDLRSALFDVWPKRRVRDASPWAVGWIGYEEAARLAGGLPCRTDEHAAPPGLLILEPQKSAKAADSDKAMPRASRLGRRWSLDAEQYRDHVEDIRRRIAAGKVYQVNLCRRLTVEGWTGSLDAFAAAAAAGGVPDFLARIKYGEGEIVCASMELLLRRRGEILETQPIKGTRPRGLTPEDDRRLAADLENDPKERAELAMIVDLERNDLGRISQIGSVRVADPGAVYPYAAVHHRVARVVGRLRPGVEWWEALGAVAPGGSVTGCPKIAAMSVITELEPTPRGPFCGAFGVVAGNGDLELALPIRTAWRVGTLLEFAAGCGIVWESDPDSEEMESRLKVARWLELVEGRHRAMA